MGSGRESRGWTNERHVDFLNSMEASFVRTILLHNNNNNNTNNNNVNGNGRAFGCPPTPLPPLDRYLPDTCDSTLDSNPQRRHSISDTMVSTRNRTDNRNRRVLQQPYNFTSQDQVVPQFESKRDNTDGDMDKNGRHVNVVPPN